MPNPLMERYSYPLGIPRDDDADEATRARQKAIANVKAKLESTRDEFEKRELIATLRKLGVRNLR